MRGEAYLHYFIGGEQLGQIQRSIAPQDNPGATYIGITTADLNRHFLAKQDAQINQLSPVGASGLFHSGFGGNHQHVKFGLLYALAHELGHITWHQQYPLTPPQPGIPCYDAIFGPSWQSTEPAKRNRWTEFGAKLGWHPGVPNL